MTPRRQTGMGIGQRAEALNVDAAIATNLKELRHD
jgi:hypothetical protein